jgi:hypothetical protein
MRQIPQLQNNHHHPHQHHLHASQGNGISQMILKNLQEENQLQMQERLYSEKVEQIRI